MIVEIYSDIVCPWCYIGKRRFEKAVAAAVQEDPIEVVFRPYQLDPSAPRAVPVRDYLAQRFGASADRMTQQVGEIARAEGIEIDWERALVTNTLRAHTLATFIEGEQGPEKQKQLIDRLFAAHFTEGLDVADPEVLVRLAVEAGADADAARELLANEPASERVLQAIEEAREVGIKAVPTFVFDGLYMVEGAQSSTVFGQVIEQVRQKAKEAASAS